MLAKTSHDTSSFMSGCEKRTSNDWNESFLKFMNVAAADNHKRVRKYSELVTTKKKKEEETLPGLKNGSSIKLNFKRKNNDLIMAPKVLFKANLVA